MTLLHISGDPFRKKKQHYSENNITLFLQLSTLNLLMFFLFCQQWSKQKSITFSSLQRNLTIVICKSIPDLP